MTKTWKVSAMALAVAVAVVAGLSAQAKWVRGAVTAMGTDTITVNVMNKDFTFKVEKSTRLVARGAGTATRQAEEAGRPGPTLGTFVKVGQSVEVEYTEAAGAMTAVEIRPVTGGEGMSSETSGSSYRGSLVVVASDSVTVKGSDNQEWKFAVDEKISVIGPGIGTKARAMRDAGKPLAIPELLKAGETVIVYYAESGGAKQAKEIRVVR